MKKDRFLHLCQESEAGRDAFVRHASTDEEGMITGCDLSNGTMFVQTPRKEARHWDFNECEDLRRPKLGPMH